jgi:hypothetical protein
MTPPLHCSTTATNQRKKAIMAINYAKLFNRRITPASRPIPASTQVANSGGGYSWQVDDWTQFDPFLILGAAGGTYYIGERELVKQNHDAMATSIRLRHCGSIGINSSATPRQSLWA